MELILKENVHGLGYKDDVVKVKDGYGRNGLQISEELAKRGFEIDRKTSVLKDVKEVGAYHAVVKLHKEVSVEIPFEVVAEEA